MSIKKVSIQKAFDAFKPDTCVFVISVDKNGEPSGMVAGWKMRCAYNPPLFAVSLWKGGYTHKLIHKSKEFVIAVPNKKMKETVEFFGTKSGRKVNKFKETKLKTLKSKYLKSPLIKDAVINLECKLKKELDLGEHIIFIGEILAAYLNPKKKKVLLNMGKIKGKWIFK